MRILLIEDNPADARLIRELLNDSRLSFELDTADTLSRGIERLRPDAADVVLLDLSLPDSTGLDTFTRVHDAEPRIPIVVMSGLSDERLAMQAVHAGAQDYLVKGDVDGKLLGRSLRYAVERKRAEVALEESNERFRKVFEEGPVGMVLVGRDRRIFEANEAFCRMVGLSEMELLALPDALELTHPEEREIDRAAFAKLYSGEIASLQREKRYLTRTGEVVWAN
ncbi:MAG: response regulator, partial [Candidatus Binatia bacterium]